MTTSALFLRLGLFPVPLNAVVKLYAITSKTVERTANRKVYFTTAEATHKIQILKVAAAPGIGHRYATPFGQSLDEFLVDPLLQTLVICRVDQELGAVRLKRLDKLWTKCQPYASLGLADISCKTGGKLTLVELCIGYGLPLVHGNKPLVVALSPAAEVDDE